MTKTEMRSLYTEAATRARCRPSESELAVWYSKLGSFDIADLKQAIDEHFKKSSWMPKESELRPLSESARQGRMVASNSKTTYARWQCPEHKMIFGGHIDPFDYRVRKCPKRVSVDRVCGLEMNPIFREDGFKTGNNWIQQ